jgi:hypothetical protein
MTIKSGRTETRHISIRNTVAGIKTTRAITQVPLSEDVKIERELEREEESEEERRDRKNQERQKESGEGQEVFFKD